MTVPLGVVPERARALVLPGPGATPVIEQRAVPAPAPGDALIRVEACGICGSDRMLWSGGFGEVFPVVPGHEAAGQVVSVGDSADAGLVGRRVALYYLDAPDGQVLPGRPNLGTGIRRMGVDVDGALADYIVRPVSTLVPADDFDPVTAAVLTDALATPFHALELAGVTAGQAVAVIGVGGIGSGAVQLAAGRGADVLAIGRSVGTEEFALGMGATRYLSSDASAEDLRAALGRAPDVVIQCVGDPACDRLAIDIAAIGSTIVHVGAATRPFHVASSELIWKGLTLRGSRGFTIDDIARVMAEYRAGRIAIDHLTSTTIDLESAPTALTDRGAFEGTRVVVAMSTEVG